jgi:sec-independent protein translocase protein TatA
MGIGPEWIVVIVVIVLLFGATRIPMLGRNIGQGIKEFKKGIRDASDDRPAPKEQAAPGQQATSADDREPRA